MINGVRERFKHKNIDGFFKQLYPFKPYYNSLVAAEVIRLCTIISADYKFEFPEIEYLIYEADKHLMPSEPEKLHDVLITIKGDKHLGIHYLPAFLASDLLLTSYDRDKFDQYKALTFLCAARLSFIGTHQPKIKAICDDVRQFSIGQRENMAAYLPNINALNLSELVQAFYKLIDDESDNRLPSNIINQLNHYRRPYESILMNSEGYTRNTISTEFKKQGHLEVGELKTLDDHGETVLFELKQFNTLPNSTNHNWQSEDHHDEGARITSIVSSYSQVQSSYAAGALKARAIQARIEKRDMHLSCDIESMTNFEVGVLVRYALEYIQAGNNSELPSKLLLVMLITGSTFEQAQQLKAKRNKDKKLIGFRRKHKLPSLKQRDELSPLLPSITDEFWLPLPQIICHRLKNLTFKSIDETHLKNLLKDINKQRGTHLTLKKVSSYLMQKLAHENIDMALVAIISGKHLRAFPTLYYLQISTGALLKIYNRYLHFLFKLSNSPLALIRFDKTPEASTIGSPLYLSTELLSSLFSKLQAKLEIVGRNTDWFHNDITIYTQLVLSLASGYRPVTGWFGKITHLSLSTGDYWISDKESGIGDNSRVVRLPETAIKVLRYYLDYCEYRASKLSNTNSALSRSYQETLNGGNHLFFYLKDELIESCVPSNYAYFIDTQFPLQANWARHHIRTLFAKNQISPALINAWMGHMNQSKRSFHALSTLTRQNMIDMASVIEEHLLDIGVEAPTWKI